MKIKKLTIHNIASIENAEVDFSGKELSGAPIFLICGETGAGKTTILDSICLALYGETPRMMSVSKEDLEFSESLANRGEKLYSNDNSQLLHRGGGEGYSKLIFEGNDGIDYEAVWEIHRAHNKAHKRLLRPTRQLRSLDGAYSENRIWEIKGKIAELTGLSYEQFCRTVMLAQGEFTKFLKSNSAEKSDILEKLTGTEIYSRLGIKIAEKYNGLKTQCQNLKSEIENVRILDDTEVSQLKEKRDSQILKMSELTKNRELIDRKLGWLETSTELNEILRKIKEMIKEIDSSLESEGLKNDRKIISDYETSAEGRGILGNIKKTESLLKIKVDLEPGLQKEEDKAWEEEKKMMTDVAGLMKSIEEIETELGKYNPEEISEKYHQTVSKEGVISSLISVLEKYFGEEKALSILTAQETELKNRIADNIRKTEEIKIKLSEAEKEWKSWVLKLDKAQLTVADFVKELRQQLQPGEMCPVCGSIPAVPVSDDHFESLLQPIKDAKFDAEEKYLNLKSSLEATGKLVNADESSLKKSAKKIAIARENLDTAAKQASSLMEGAGMSEFTREEALEKCGKEKDELRLEIKRLRELQNECERLSGNLKEQQKNLDNLRKKIDDVKDHVVKCRIARQSLISEIEAYRKSREQQETSLKEFLERNPDISSVDYLRRLSEYDPEEIESKRDGIISIENNLKNEIGKKDALENQIIIHNERKPEFEDEEASDFLKEERTRVDTVIKELSEDNGKIQEILNRDEESRKSIVKKKEEYDFLKEELDVWNELYDKLGDLKGVRFRSVAQSFILRSLLDNANIYMRCFNDRYTLTCNPGSLVILVKDNFNPGEPQPSSILSGGESFMASLSLALALSNLRSGGMAVDILFIDEGFGTLSAEYLGNVMETLEKLHQIGGRKVGIISHVADLRERIPVQIQVHRTSPALSKVAVIENYG